MAATAPRRGGKGRRQWARHIVWSVSSLLTFACGDGQPSTEAGPAGTPSSTNMCTVDSFSPALETAQLEPRRKTLRYTARSEPNAPFDALVLESRQDGANAGPRGPGSYLLNGANYVDCGLCLYAVEGFDGEGYNRVYFADAGVVQINQLSGPGQPFSAVLRHVTLREVTIDARGRSVPVPGGRSWCLNGYSINVTLEEDAAEPSCVTAGTGTDVGDNIANFSLQNCNGDWIDLHSFCQQPKALWLMMVTGWCPACAEAVPQVAAIQRDYHAEGLDVMVVMGEDDRYDRPTLEFCQRYAASHDIDPSLVYLDYGDTVGSFETSFTHINPYVTDSIGLPWSAVLRGSNMEYYYSDTSNTGDLNAALNELLQ